MTYKIIIVLFFLIIVSNIYSQAIEWLGSQILTEMPFKPKDDTATKKGINNGTRQMS